MKGDRRIDKKFYGLIIIVAVPVLLGTLFFYTGTGQEIWTWDIRRLADTYASLGALAILISIGLNILQTFVIIMPSVFLSGVNALAFGLFWGTVISWTGEVAGAAISFFLYRYLGRGTIEGLEKNHKYLERIDQLSSQRGFRTVLLLRLLPAFPSGVVNLLAALSGITFSSFLIATAIGKVPSLVLEALVGHDIFTWQENLSRLLIILGVIALAYAVKKYADCRRKD